MHNPRSGGAAGSVVCGATDKSAAEWLEAALLGNILIEPRKSGLRRFVIFGDSLADRRDWFPGGRGRCMAPIIAKMGSVQLLIIKHGGESPPRTETIPEAAPQPPGDLQNPFTLEMGGKSSPESP
jgi:hypothetical protein